MVSMTLFILLRRWPYPSLTPHPIRSLYSDSPRVTTNPICNAMYAPNCQTVWPAVSSLWPSRDSAQSKLTFSRVWRLVYCAFGRPFAIKSSWIGWKSRLVDKGTRHPRLNCHVA
ncbi:hypothetical protein CPB86DRAFT_162004 [Serendipita vermifera]|nr:hypothetical protein CPB86DRAFT_162004 [Serendipita vermifera]